METKVRNILKENLPESFNVIVEKRSNPIGGGHYLKIAFSPNSYEINQVRGQFPQVVSLNLDLRDMELTTQVFGGNGGGKINREPDRKNPMEAHLYCKHIKIPFRRPQKSEAAVLRAIENFCKNYIKTLKKYRPVLKYKEIVDYSFLDQY